MKILLLLAVLGLGLLLLRSISLAAPLPQTGQPAPDFSLPDQNGKTHRLADYAGRWLVLYFYPKDDTPGCIKQACSFRDDLFQLEKMGAKVVGISVDDSDSHAKFAAKYHLPFPLLADQDATVADRYGALNNLLFMKIAKRYTFLIDPQGNIAKSYLSVDTSRHSQEFIEHLKRLATLPAP